MKGKVVAVNISQEKGTRKKPTATVLLEEEKGIVGDAHAEGGHRQVSLLAQESIEKIREKGLDVHWGDFAENITTEGLPLHTLPVGTKLKIGETLLEVTQIGKECLSPCQIYRLVGDCVMPKEGIFVRVIKGGSIKEGDTIEVVD